MQGIKRRFGAHLGQIAAHQLPHHVVGVGQHRSTGVLGQGAGAGVLFPAAAAAAHTGPPALHHNGMAQLGTGVVEAGKNLAVDDDSAADSGTQGDGHRILCPLGRTGDVFAIGRRIGVVLNIHLAAQQRFHVGLQRPIVVAEVRVELHHAALAVHAAGGADAHPLQVAHRKLMLFGQLTAKPCNLLLHFFRRPRQPGEAACTVHNVMVFVHKAGRNGRAAQIYANGILFHSFFSSLCRCALQRFRFCCSGHPPGQGGSAAPVRRCTPSSSGGS